MTTLVVHLNGVTVGPDDWLVLSAREPLESGQAQKIRDQIPEALRGRVLIVDQLDTYVMAAVQ